ncbi:MAG: putative Na+/H+ antiporter [Verrucomicrobiota bacterium]
MTRLLHLPTALWLLLSAAAFAADGADQSPAYPRLGDGGAQYAAFPRPLESYPVVVGGMVATLQARAVAEPFNVAASVIFLLAILHTFAASRITKRANHYERAHAAELARRAAGDDHHPDRIAEVSFKATTLHFLGEVEAVFGLWVLALAAAAVYYYSWHDFLLYLGKDRVFTEPIFVVVIMAIAASRPVLQLAESLLSKAAALGRGSPAAWWLSVLVLAPILGSLITEPAAMTIAALLLAKKFYRFEPSAPLAYGTLGLLFVNISVGGTLTHFAAPPVLMVAGKWGWGTSFMFTHFGWKALLGILLSSGLYCLWFRKPLYQLCDRADGTEDGQVMPVSWQERATEIPPWVTFVHLAFLGWTVYTAHFPALFIGAYLFYIAFTTATRHHQNPVSLRGPMLVGFFLAGLVVHGGCQGWWIAPVISALRDQTLMLGATVLTAFNDNAAITYLAAQVQDLTLGAKYAVVAGAVTGGGLTVIANAPNPAGQNILARFFKDGISPLGLLLGALVPTLIVYLCFILLPNSLAKDPPAQLTPAVPALEKIIPTH